MVGPLWSLAAQEGESVPFGQALLGLEKLEARASQGRGQHVAIRKLSRISQHYSICSNNLAISESLVRAWIILYVISFSHIYIAAIIKAKSWQ